MGLKRFVWNGIAGFVMLVGLCAILRKDIQEESASAVLQGSQQESVGQSVEREAAPLEVHFIDVGQGDATLIVCEDDAMLIDTGQVGLGTLLWNYLKRQGVDGLEYLVLTHPDSDHIGSADVIINKFDIATVLMPDYAKENSTYERLVEAMEYKRLKGTLPVVGEEYSLGEAEFTIVAPNGSYEDPNNSSIAFLLEYGDTSFLFTGDAEERAEEDMLKCGIALKADVYKVGHHGSSTSSGKAFLDAVEPEYAVVSCGENNEYGHPHDEVMDELRKRTIKVFRTDMQGDVIAFSDGREITWNCVPYNADGKQAENAEIR